MEEKRIEPYYLGRGEPDLGGLRFVVHILNFDFDSEDHEDGFSRLLLSGQGFDLADPQWISKARQLQEEIRQDLLPLIKPKKALSPRKAYNLLEVLVEKINLMGLTQQWLVVPVDHIVEDNFGMTKPKLIRKDTVDDLVPGFVTEFPEVVRKMYGLKPQELERLLDLGWEEEPERIIQRLGRDQRILKLFGQRWVIKPRVLITTQDPARQKLYWNILRSLENGEIMWLGRCPRRECQRFFIAKRRGQTYCSLKCTRAADKKAAPNRMREHRRSIEEKTKAEGLPKLSQLGDLIQKSRAKTDADLLDQIPELKKFREHSKGYPDRVWSDLMGVVEEIREGHRIDERLWNRLRPQLRKALAEAPL